MVRFGNVCSQNVGSGAGFLAASTYGSVNYRTAPKCEKNGRYNAHRVPKTQTNRQMVLYREFIFSFANIKFCKRVELFTRMCYNIKAQVILDKEGSFMRISYNKLWKMLIDKNMKKSDLKEQAGISSASLAKLGKGENITTDVLLRICTVMDCNIEDILETVRD